MPIKIAINGLGRIGRGFLKKAWDDPAIEIVGLNSRSSAEIYAHLLKYDSMYGTWDKDVSFEGEDLVIDGKKITLHHEKDPNTLPWKNLGVDLVIEATGCFRERDKAALHLEAGAKYVMISAPGKDEDKMLLYNINHEEFDPAKHKIISAVSCTTTCLAPVAKILHENFGIVHGYVVTVHAYTSDQQLVDSPHKKEDKRRSRSAGESIVPTSTGAAKAIGKILPELDGKLNGIALRVPVSVPSVISFTVELKKKVTVEEVNKTFVKEKANYPDLFDATELELVSKDYVGNTYGSIVDLPSTQVVDDKMVQVLAWYDNEWGYISQLYNLVKAVGEKIK